MSTDTSRMTALARVFRKGADKAHRGAMAVLIALAVMALGALPATAQPIETIDPSSAIIDGDLAERPGDAPIYAEPDTVPATTAVPPRSSVDDAFRIDSDLVPLGEADAAPAYDAAPAPQAAGQPAPSWSDPDAYATQSADTAPTVASDTTYKEDDLIGAAEGVFGDGAQGVAGMIRKLLKEQGEPNAYIVGREAGGAFVLGARYGSGTLFHKVEGQRTVYWTGPSIGFDAGANAGSTFVLVYNLYDSEDLFKRFPAGEGQAYLVGGLSTSYLRRGDVVLIPVRVGAGVRLGINAGYMRFSKKHRWLPF